VEFLNFGVEVVEGCPKRARQGIVLGEKRGPVRPEDAEVEFGVEEGDFESVAGSRVAVRVGNAMDQPLETQPPQVVGHLRGAVGAAEQRFDLRAEIAIAESARQMREGAESLEQGHDAGIGKAQRGDALTVCDRGVLSAIEGVLGQDTVVTDALDFEELAINLVAEVAQV
jgi:hypothetical protein